MRLPPFPEGTLPAGLESGSDLAPASLEAGLIGAWSATRWQYTSRGEESRQSDLVCDLHGTITLSLSDGTWILAAAVPGRGMHTLGGTYTARGGAIELMAPKGGVEQVIRFRVSGELLSLQSEASSWDFGDEGRDEPASLIAVFVRL